MHTKESCINAFLDGRNRHNNIAQNKFYNNDVNLWNINLFRFYELYKKNIRKKI